MPNPSGGFAAGIAARDAVLRWMRRWPRERGLAALVSGPGGGRWARRSILAEPQEIRTIRTPHGLPPAEARRAVEKELRTLLRRTTASRSPDAGWVASVSYDFGRVVEPKAGARSGQRAARDDRDWPLMILAWCPDALIIDHATGAHRTIGDPDRIPIDLSAEIEASDCIPTDVLAQGSLELLGDRRDFEGAVEACVRLIHEGDLFQANLARRISCAFSGSTRALAERAFRASGAWFGAYLEAEGRTVISMSPELFLALDHPSRRVVTRPIKGTRRGDRDPSELLDSAKDRAELAMIVDLMRNDLGRVCRIGTVQVDDARSIETHPTVHHGVAEVSGFLRDDVDAVALLAATFPPGSVTGAPKVRAMQVIDELEPRRRGAYCGATGLFGTDGSVMLNVAIRTIALSGRSDPRAPAILDGTLDYWAGGGIVADSVPSAEWEETVAKSEVLLRALDPSR